MPRTPRKWTPREDEQLLRGVLMQGTWNGERFQKEQEANSTFAFVDGGIGKPVDWSILAQSFANRTNRDCRKRWLKIDKKWNRGAWEAEEDEILLKAVERHEKKYDTTFVSILYTNYSPQMESSLRNGRKAEPRSYGPSWASPRA